MSILDHLSRQSHLLTYLDTLKPVQRDKLTDHLLKFNFDHFADAFDRALAPELPNPEDIEQIDPNRYVDREKLSVERLDELMLVGLKAISEGRVGAVVLAGGQASRLGSNCPKGVITLGTGLPTCTDSLLFLQAAQIAFLQQMALEYFPNSKPEIAWLVMTSQSTHEETRKHLDEVIEETGLTWDQVLTFRQNEIPAFDFDGKVFLASPTELVTSPDGHGGIYDAIRPLIPTLERRGVQYFHVFCVDNILCRVADPHMIGCAIEMNADCAAKVVEKKDPAELVGHVCLEKGRVRVLEYSEISVELAEQCDPKDPSKLLLRAGSIANHFFTLNFLREACQMVQQMPYHMARKKIPHMELIGSQVTQVHPQKPNGIKLERFIFDAFCHSKNFLLWQVPPDDEFSPLKNPDSSGRDCLSTCLRSLNGPQGKWIRDACIACGSRKSAK